MHAVDADHGVVVGQRIGVQSDKRIGAVAVVTDEARRNLADGAALDENASVPMKLKA